MRYIAFYKISFALLLLAFLTYTVMRIMSINDQSSGAPIGLAVITMAASAVGTILLLIAATIHLWHDYYSVDGARKLLIVPVVFILGAFLLVTSYILGYSTNLSSNPASFIGPLYATKIASSITLAGLVCWLISLAAGCLIKPQR